MAAAGLATILLINLILVLSRTAHADTHGRIRHLEFYMHDIVKSRHHPTAAVIVQPPAGGSSPFGSVVVIDDKLTEGPDPKSAEVGRGQGTYTLASVDSIDFFLVFTAVFPDGSTLSFQGSDRTSLVSRDISIVGATGRFIFARGFATIRTFSLHPPNAVLGFNCTIAY